VNLSSSQRQYLLIGQCLVPLAINFVLNGLIAFGMFRGLRAVPIWAMKSSAGPDLIGTCFFLPAITCLIVTPIVRRHIRRGLVAPASWSESLPGALRLFRRALPMRALLFGLVGLGLFGSFVAAVLVIAGPASLGLTPFVWLKASFSAALGGVVTPIIGLVALTEGGQQGAGGLTRR
jgi:hypothetical protein